MPAGNVSASGTKQIDWGRAEFVLTGLGVLGFITLAIKITTVWDGIPAHPLFIHVPVILIPLSIIGALACVIRPAWFSRYGILLCAISIVAMSSIFLAMQAGAALEAALHLTGQTANLISQHSRAADILAFIFIAFTAILILTFSAQRISGEMGPTGFGLVDRILGARSVLLTLRTVLVILALAAAFMVFRVGDLGAKAVWQGRIQAAQGGVGFGPRGGPPNGSFTRSG